jgi:hypothetical protein
MFCQYINNLVAVAAFVGGDAEEDNEGEDTASSRNKT